ncbi:MAG: hypothetical protein IJ833_05750 [Lachnospiraceae bacterium]|nr:hypothetical protein [Lachnospiraceae bacterium]
MNNENRPEWMNDEIVQDISPEKLDFLEKMYQNGHGKNQKELMAFMMPMLKQAKEQNLIFTPQEMNAAITAIRRHSTREELAQMDKILERAQKGK